MNFRSVSFFLSFCASLLFCFPGLHSIQSFFFNVSDGTFKLNDRFPNTLRFLTGACENVLRFSDQDKVRF